MLAVSHSCTAQPLNHQPLNPTPTPHRDGPSQLVALPEERVWELDAGSMPLPAALALLAQELGAGAVRPLVDCRGVFCPPARPLLPSGVLRCAAAVCFCAAAVPLSQGRCG